MCTSESKIAKKLGKRRLVLFITVANLDESPEDNIDQLPETANPVPPRSFTVENENFSNEDEQLLRLKSSKTKKETLFWSWKKCKVQRMAATAEDKPWGWITCPWVYFSNIWCSICFYNSWNSKKLGQLYHMSVISVRKLVFLCQPSHCTVAEMEWACTFHVDQSISLISWLFEKYKEQAHPLDRSLNFD